MSAASFLRSSSDISGKASARFFERALLPVEAGRDQAPQDPGMARRGLERIGARDRLEDPESRVFQAKAQVFGERHQSARPIGSQGRKRLIAQAPPHCQASASGGVSGATFVTFLDALWYSAGESVGKGVAERAAGAAPYRPER